MCISSGPPPLAGPYQCLRKSPLPTYIFIIHMRLTWHKFIYAFRIMLHTIGTQDGLELLIYGFFPTIHLFQSIWITVPVKFSSKHLKEFLQQEQYIILRINQCVPHQIPTCFLKHKCKRIAMFITVYISYIWSFQNRYKKPQTEGNELVQDD